MGDEEEVLVGSVGQVPSTSSRRESWDAEEIFESLEDWQQTNAEDTGAD